MAQPWKRDRRDGGKHGGKTGGKTGGFGRGPRQDRAAESDVALIWGAHPVEAALANPGRDLRRLLATENAARRLAEAGLGRIAPEIVAPREIDRLVPSDAVHQGLLLEAEPLPALELDDLPDEGVVLALDQITDPHNVGAILRTAAAFAVRAIVLPLRHSPAATGVLAKAASGALEHVPLVAVRNLGNALTELGERGFWRVGLDSEGDAALEDAPLRAPLVLALGAEGKGLRERVRGCCDLTARIDLPGAIKSLNVSNACAIALATAHRRLAAP